MSSLMKLKLLAGVPVNKKDGTRKKNTKHMTEKIKIKKIFEQGDQVIHNGEVYTVTKTKIIHPFVGIEDSSGLISFVPKHQLSSLNERKDYDTDDEFSKGDKVKYNGREYTVVVPDARGRLVGIKKPGMKKVKLVLADELEKVVNEQKENKMITVGKVGLHNNELVIVENVFTEKVTVVTLTGFKRNITPKDFKPVKVKKSKYLKEALYKLTGIVPDDKQVLTEDHYQKGELALHKPTKKTVKVLRSVRGKQDSEQYLVQDEKTLDVFVADAVDLQRKKVAEGLSVVVEGDTLEKSIVIKKDGNNLLTVFTPKKKKVKKINENTVIVTNDDPLKVLLESFVDQKLAEQIVKQWKMLNEQDLDKLVLNDPSDDKNESPEQLNALKGGKEENQPPQDNEVKVEVPREIIKLLDEEIKKAEQAIESEVDLNAGNKEAAVQYKNLARAFKDLKRYLEKGTIHDLKKAQIYLTSLYTPILSKVPAKVVKFIMHAVGGLKKDWYTNQLKEVE